MIDASELGVLVAGFMESIETDFGEHATLGTIAVIAEVNVDEENDPNGHGYTQLTYRCSDQRRWVQSGFFEAAKRATVDGVAPPDEDGE